MIPDDSSSIAVAAVVAAIVSWCCALAAPLRIGCTPRATTAPRSNGLGSEAKRLSRKG